MGLSKKKRDLLRNFVEHTCEECHKTELELSLKENKVIRLQPHRINQGMEYSIRNIKMICPKCHSYFSSAQNKSRGIIGTKNKFKCKCGYVFIK